MTAAAAEEYNDDVRRIFSPEMSSQVLRVQLNLSRSQSHFSFIHTLIKISSSCHLGHLSVHVCLLLYYLSEVWVVVVVVIVRSFPFNGSDFLPLLFQSKSNYRKWKREDGREKERQRPRFKFRTKCHPTNQATSYLEKAICLIACLPQ